MKIRNIAIRNYRSLKDVSLEKVGDLTVLIGANSSGKTNFLEALAMFFTELDPSVQRNIGAINDEYVWFDRTPQQPIEITVGIEVPKEQLPSILPSELSASITGQPITTITITRTISGTFSSAVWQTKDVAINGTALIKDGKFVQPVREPHVEQTTSEPSSQAPPPPDYSGSILQNISQQFKGRFKLVSAARNMSSMPSGLTLRTAFIQPTIIGELVRLGQAVGSRAEEKQWIDVHEHVKRAAPSITDVRIMGGRLTVREEGSDMHFPIDATGGGYQETVGLLYEVLKGEAVVYAIEEPEAHLHPELARRLFADLQELSKGRQIIVTTHSPIFVDQADLSNTWIVRKEYKETKVLRVEDPKELRNILYELGLRPSDLFFSDGIIFVEGSTERIVLPILAHKMGMDFEKSKISVIPIYGKSSGRYHLHVWTEAARNVNISFFMILDQGAEKEVKKLRGNLLRTGENLFFLKKGPIEDYYPEEPLIEALHGEFGVEVSVDDRKKILSSPRDKSVEEFLKAKGKETSGWKVTIGKRVAESMNIDELDEEIRRILERIATKVRMGGMR